MGRIGEFYVLVGRLFGLEGLAIGADGFEGELDVGGMGAGAVGVDDFDDFQRVTGVND